MNDWKLDLVDSTLKTQRFFNVECINRFSMLKVKQRFKMKLYKLSIETNLVLLKIGRIFIEVILIFCQNYFLNRCI